MARKGENIYRRKDGRWEGRYVKGRRPDGKAQYGSVYGKKYNEVRDKLIPLKAAHAAMRAANICFIGTLWDWLTYWLNELEKPHIKPATYASYRNKLENHVMTAMGDKKLSKLTSDDIQKWVDGMTAKGLAGSTVRTIFRVLNTALEKAVDRHCLFANPCRDVVLPSVEKPGIRALTVAEQKELERQALSGNGNEAVMIALYTGMRIGEISALMWSDIDFEANLIHVSRTLQRIIDYEGGGAKTKIIIDLPKSDTSNRTIPFADNLKAHLLKWKAASDSEYVVSCKGSFAEPRVISYRFRQAAKRAGLSGVTFHALRHTYATRCIERGIDIVTLSRLLGHASPKLTLDTYADSTLEQRKAAMLTLDMLLAKDSAEARDAALFMADRQRIVTLINLLFSTKSAMAG